MIYRILADIVMLLHLGFILWVVLGWLFVRWRRWLMWLHLPAAAWGVLIEFLGWPCPLTPLEQYLRGLGGQEGFENGFIEHYIGSIIYPGGLDRSVQILLGVAVLVVNLVGYWWALSRKPRSGTSGQSPGEARVEGR